MRKIHYKDAVVGRIKKIKSSIIINSYSDDNPGMHSVVLLAGSGRSGSTWLADVISSLTGMRVIFEPLLPNMYDEVSGKFIFTKSDHPEKEGKNKEFRLFIKDDAEANALTDSLQNVFFGKIPRNEWRDRRLKKLNYHGRIIKEIRANLILPFISANFQKIDIICVLRHPCAVVSSQFYLGWKHDMDEILSQKDLLDYLPTRFIELAHSLNTDIEKLAFRWALENYIPLTQLPPGACTYISYEHLVINDPSEWEILEKSIGITKADTDKMKLFNIRGMTLKNKSELKDSKKLISGWREKLASSEQDSIMKVITAFGLNDIYTANEDLPDINSLRNFYNIDEAIRP